MNTRAVTGHRTAPTPITGHFKTRDDYAVWRPHGTDGYLLVLTVSGHGRFASAGGRAPDVCALAGRLGHRVLTHHRSGRVDVPPVAVPARGEIELDHREHLEALGADPLLARRQHHLHVVPVGDGVDRDGHVGHEIALVDEPGGVGAHPGVRDPVEEEGDAGAALESGSQHVNVERGVPCRGRRTGGGDRE